MSGSEVDPPHWAMGVNGTGQLQICCCCQPTGQPMASCCSLGMGEMTFAMRDGQVLRGATLRTMIAITTR